MRLFSVYSYSYSSLIILCMALRSNMAGSTFLRSDADFGRIRLDAILTAGRDSTINIVHSLPVALGWICPSSLDGSLSHAVCCRPPRLGRFVSCTFPPRRPLEAL